jgi:hypothetical protein
MPDVNFQMSVYFDYAAPLYKIRIKLLSIFFSCHINAGYKLLDFVKTINYNEFPISIFRIDLMQIILQI